MGTQNENKENKPKKVKLSVKMGWSSLTISSAISLSLLSYFTLYASDVMGLSTGVVGVLLMVSKVFDGITDLIAGFIIDRTHTRFGKARPYALAIIFYWIALAALFSIPTAMSQNLQYVYLFVMYTLANSVFCTLYSCAEAPHMANALEEPSQSLVLLSFSSVLSAIAGIAGGVMIPQFAVSAGTDPAQWSYMAWLLAIPLAIIGSFRFILVRERTHDAKVETQQINIRETLQALKENKYILILSLLVFLAYFISQMGSSVSSYYTKYIIGDLGSDSIMSLSLAPVIFVMAFIPGLVRKFTMKRVVNFLMILAIAGPLIRLLDPTSLGWSFFCACIGSVGGTAFYGFASTLVIDCMDYGEYKTGKRVEGVMGSVQSFMNKIGTGLGVAVAGVMLQIGGFVGTAETQTESALHMIIAMMTVVPAALGVLFLLLWKQYDLEAQLPEIHAELERRRAAAGVQNVSGEKA